MTKYLPDYYKILQIDTNADKSEIKKAYKKISKKYDTKTNNTAKTKKIQKIIDDAYIVLSDDKKRKKYDKIRKEVLQNKNTSKIKKTDAKSTLKIANDAKDTYDLISKVAEIFSPMKGKALMTAPNIILGGAMAGYGIKKGRDYMAKRRFQNKK